MIQMVRRGSKWEVWTGAVSPREGWCYMVSFGRRREARALVRTLARKRRTIEAKARRLLDRVGWEADTRRLADNHVMIWMGRNCRPTLVGRPPGTSSELRMVVIP